MNALARLTRNALPLNLARAYGTKTCFVGNIPWGTSQQELQDLFGQYGPVENVRLPLDDSGRMKGFGFVEIDEDAAPKAIESLNGHSFNGRDLRVSEAQSRPRAPRTFNDRPRFNREQNDF
ncbi:hypothetical protein K493DRAFT_321351 [Basidiobolus meristosporus CBS 931.73]|uniref:RRM domain-containing protein n=1 Tax=Basidiobolus meristosporus CBS 931.73 TaxID=1314790 RepID=A0A1Y1WW91_9FUNG|nr:hypothetical protein K493DRAFT_321351 [Basidiobolus meristosporus CBS 931.73]|eukprot:ORX77578.1 hypothetical protein K493DRAFT_321351 [Basidiobolus meristosporus CBS 931.73]